MLKVDGRRLGLARCKDIDPQHASDTAAPGIDAYLAGTLESQPTPPPEARARRVATDRHRWVAVASFAGSTGGGYAQAAGHCSSWICEGDDLAWAGTQAGVIAHATLN